jgi:ABC-type uncharacterized transport system YnjBCD ATPase subunit
MLLKQIILKTRLDAALRAAFRDSRWDTKREGTAFAVPSLLTIHDGIEAFKPPCC